MNGMKTANVRTLFPVSSVRPSFRPKSSINANIEKRENMKLLRSALIEPLYKIESEVTAAIVTGTLIGFALTRYAEAKSYQVAIKKAR